MAVEAEGHVKISDYLSGELTVGEPAISGSIGVYPVFGPAPDLDYITLAKAIPMGFVVKEVDGDGSVRDLIVHNPTEHNVLLFEGEEVLGAQQNRTFDASILVPAGAQMPVPVSCVEAGRWDGSRNSEQFARAEQMAYPQMRREKARQAGRARSAGMEARANQQAVWSEVNDRAAMLRAATPTASINDVFETRRSDLRQMTAAIPAHDGQIGSLLQIGAEIRALDLVSRPDAYADLHVSLVQGYALDGLTPETITLTAKSAEPKAKEFISQVTATQVHEGDGIGLGRDFRFESEVLLGSGLVSGSELIQISVFDDRDGGGDAGGAVSRDPSAANYRPQGDSSDSPSRRARIRRPSRRWR
jgi:hypothetical protein